MKKALALILVLVLALGMSSVAFAAGKKIDKKTWSYDYLVWAGNGAIDDQDAKSDARFNIVIDSDLKYDGGGTVTPTASGGSISKDDINKSSLDIRIKWSKGSQVFDDCGIEKSQTGMSYLWVSHATKITTVKDIDFKYTVMVAFGNSNLSGSTYGEAPVVEGTYAPEEEDEWDDDWFEFTGGNFVVPNTFIRKMEYQFNADIGVNVYGRALKGVKYYGWADDDVDDAAEELMIKYPAISAVYHLKQINVLSVADYVKLDQADATMYVYDGDLNYLGRGNANLPYADTYYLAAAELDVDTDIEPEDEEEEDYEIEEGDNSEGGGDDLYPSNPHDNPGTGK